MSRVVCVALAVAAVLAASSVFGYSSYKSSTSVWDLQIQQSPITLDANTIYVSGTGIRLANNATSGTVGFYGTNAPFSANWAVPSWNLDEPAGTGFRTEVRGVNGSTTTAWYEVRRDGTIPGGITRVKSDSYGSIADDTLILKSKWPRMEYRVTLYTNAAGVTPTLRLMSLCYADSKTSVTYTELGSSPYMSLAVPWRSQYWVPGIGGIICGPTSMSMALAYNGCNLDTATFAAECYDDYNDMYGNWPCIAQGAARHGFKSYYARANGNNQVIRDFLAQGVPVEIGMAYSAGELTNSPISSTAGHLVLCVGMQANGDWICNDPAGSNNFWDHVTYLKGEMGNVWYTHSATVIPCIPNSVYWRFPYYPYKSTDPISVNKAGVMELFAKTPSGTVYHMWQTSPNGGWTPWSSMGGTAASEPVAVTNRTGGNTVFARFTDDNLYYNWQNGSGGAWSGWLNLGGPVAGRPAVGKSPDGRMDVFCRMLDGSIQHKWESASTGWQSWVSLGGNVAGDPVVGLNWEGREEVFVRGGDNQLYHAWQRNDGTWSGFASLGGPVAGEPAVGKVSDGRIEIYCRFADGSMRHNWQTSRNVGTSWNGWVTYSGSTSFDMAAARTPGFIQEIYSCSSSGAILRAYQTSLDGGWSSWESLGGTSECAPIVSHNEDGRIQIFIVQSDGRVWSKWRTTGGGWSAWTAFGDALFGDTALPDISSVVVSPDLVLGGDRLTVTANVSDDTSVASVTAKNAEDASAAVELANQGDGVWKGSIYARGNLGSHAVRVTATDGAGNAAVDTTGSYTTTRAYSVSNKGAADAIMSSAHLQYLFIVFGTVTYMNVDQFSIDDGSHNPLLVDAVGHGLTTGDHARVRGRMIEGPLHLESSAGFITAM